MQLFFKQRRSLTAPSSAAISRHNRGRTGRILIPGVAAGLMALTVGYAASARAAAGTVPVNDSSFKCLKSMVKVRHFYVDNFLGNRAATVAVATKDTGVYPVGSVLQLVPGEVMVKQQKGFSPVTKDWEFFELDVSKEGSKIRKRGFADVVNRFGGNCFACHVKARPEFDLVCELEHGCDPIPITRRMIAAIQETDPRCPGSENVSAEDKKALDELGEVVKEMMKANGVAPEAAGKSEKTDAKGAK